MDERQQTPGGDAQPAGGPHPAAVAAPTERPRPRRVAAADVPPPPKPRVRTRTKVCGITRIEDARLAVEHGAWALGLIFWRGSKRRCGFERAQMIGAAFKRQVEVAGVFVNAPLDEIDRAVDACSLTIVQLHGDEGPSFCAEVARRTGAQVVKAARVRTAADVVALRTYRTDFHLLDAYAEGTPGGTGRTFDHDLARVHRAARGERAPKLILSGGLNPENVAAAAREVRPFAVDVASGVEQAPGVKDPAKLEAFLTAVREAWDEPAAEPSAADEPAAAPTPSDPLTPPSR